MFAKKQQATNTKLWPKLLFFLFGIFVVTTQVTDADLLDIEVIPNNSFEATTLDFSNRQTANNLQISTLFSVFGLVPGGFQVESLRIKKDGEMDFSYQITSEFGTGDGLLCQELDIVVLQEYEKVYEGKLSEFYYSSRIFETEIQDLVIFIRLDNSDQSLMNLTCNFNFLFQTVEENTGFIDYELVQNQVSAGVWSN